MSNLEYDNKKTIVGYQGVPGSYSQIALVDIFGEDVSTTNVVEFDDVFKLLEEEKIDFGILPIENTSTGGVSDVVDMLNKYDVHIVEERRIKINHCLLGIKGTNLETIEEVYSHPQGFGQCKNFLKEKNNWKLITYYNTAKSVELIKGKNSVRYAAIASELAAKIYDMDIIKTDINDNKSNYTRFVVLSKKLYCDDDSKKISIVISLPHKCGSLNNIIKCIAENGLNMQKIESRPIVGKPWEYFFYIDFEGNIKDKKVEKALEEIKENSLYFKLLGNYKSDQII